MLKRSYWCVLCLALFYTSNKNVIGKTLGPWVSMTNGQIWPKPQIERTEPYFFILEPEIFNFLLNSEASQCEIITTSLIRFKKRMFPISLSYNENNLEVEFMSNKPYFIGRLKNVKLNLMSSSECKEYPKQNMNEQYEIRLLDETRADILAPSVWGLLKGLESLTQLVYISSEEVYVINSTQIFDYPRFSFRGLLIDSSRHFLSKDVIYSNLNLMEMNKYNVLHWHLTDDPSFPFVSTRFPNLSKKGAYDSETHVYSPQDVKDIVEFARRRGIRVLPEFDTPGHTQSWGLGAPGLLTNCYSKKKPNGLFGPIDPSQESSYTFLNEFFEEVTSRFPDDFVHLGGDEVDFDCWASNPHIKSFMAAHNISGNYSQLESYFMTRLIQIVNKKNKEYLVWNDVFDNNVTLNNNTIVHLWSGNITKKLEQITSSGFRAILSAGWYLDWISYGPDWSHYYNNDPHAFNGTQEQKNRILGGEACIWGEYVNNKNLIPRVWPRASAIAERLWSSVMVKDVHEASHRLQEMECRMLRRGYSVEPVIGPSYCKYTLN